MCSNPNHRMKVSVSAGWFRLAEGGIPMNSEDPQPLADEISRLAASLGYPRQGKVNISAYCTNCSGNAGPKVQIRFGFRPIPPERVEAVFRAQCREWAESYLGALQQSVAITLALAEVVNLSHRRPGA